MLIKFIFFFCNVQWSIKEENGDFFKIIDINVEEFRGMLNLFFGFVLVIIQCEKL